jgi:hypothetical protein
MVMQMLAAGGIPTVQHPLVDRLIELDTARRTRE